MTKAGVRIEELLNRAGSTISDLRKPKEDVYAYPVQMTEIIQRTALAWNGIDDREPTETEIIDALQDYALHLVEVIDRMETALINTLVKLDECKEKADENE